MKLSPRLHNLRLVILLGMLCTASIAQASKNDAAENRDTQADAQIQIIANNEVRSALRRSGATSAALVVVEPETGELLAFAEAGKTRWRKREFSPGSVIKPFLFAAAIESGTLDINAVVDCQGPLLVGGREFRDPEALGQVSTSKALSASTNVGAIRIGQKLGFDRLRRALSAFGLAEDVANARHADDLRLARLSLGLGVKTTMLDVARAYGQLASSTHDDIQRMLVAAVEEGTGKQAGLPGVTVAGKTGTVSASHLERGSNVSPATIASFVGFAPAEDPRFVVYALVETPNPSASGGTAAAPLFRRVTERLLALP